MKKISLIPQHFLEKARLILGQNFATVVVVAVVVVVATCLVTTIKKCELFSKIAIRLTSKISFYI